MSRFSDLLKQAETAHTHPKTVPQINAQPSLGFSQAQEKFLSSQAPKMVLTALAGSGKTSCLLEYARRRPHQKWNFVVFNRSVADAVAPIAPKNMTVRTAHQMAFAHFGHDLQHKIKDKYSLQEVAALCSDIPSVAHKDYAKLVVNVATEYLNSADIEISQVLVSNADWENLKLLYPDVSWDINVLLDHVKVLWRLSLDPSSNLSIPHDVYLKRFSMVDGAWNGTYWMLDEGQDWSDAFLSCWKRSAPVSVRAGDPFQKLYDWRGASSQKWCTPDKETEFWLTHSFRSGTGIEPWVNLRLKALGCLHQWNGAKHTCAVSHQAETAQSIKDFAPDVVLATRWDDLENISNIMKTMGIAHYFKGDAPNGVLLSTIHGAKGLEYNNVWIADNALPPDEHAVQRARLAYVAVTRSKRAVRIPSEWPKIETDANLFDDF